MKPSSPESDPSEPLPVSLPPSALRGALSGGALVIGSIFVLSGLALAFSMGGFENEFTKLARERYLGQVIWNNLKLLPAYAMIYALVVAVCYPALSGWRARLLAKGKQPRRRGMMWRGACLTFALFLYGLLWLAVDHIQLIPSEPLQYAVGTFTQTAPAWLRHGLWIGIFGAIPAAALLGVLAFYARRSGHPRAVFGTVVAGLGVAGALAVGKAKPDYSVESPGISATEAPADPAADSRDRARATRPRPPGAKPKNVLIIASDSLRPDHLSCYGYGRETSPNIDAVAEDAFVFDQYFTPIGSTVESWITLLSSQYPHTHGIQHMFPNREQVETLEATAPSLAGLLREQGYETAVIGDWCAASFHVAPMGVEEINVSSYDNFELYLREAVLVHHVLIPLCFDNQIGRKIFPELESFTYFMTPEAVAEKVVDRIEARAEAEDEAFAAREKAAAESAEIQGGGDVEQLGELDAADSGEGELKPFFWIVFCSSTHLPYNAPPPWHEKWSDPAYAGPSRFRFDFDVDAFIANVDVAENWRGLPEEEIAQVNALYDGCVGAFDACVGQILDALERGGLADDTIVAISSDHGDDLFEPNTTMGHGLSFNGGDQSNRIPLILRVPGQEDKARRVPTIARTIDLAPTLCSLLEVDADPRFEGTDLSPALVGGEPDPDLAFFGETSYLFFKREIPGEEPLYIPPMDKTVFVDESFEGHFVLKDKFQQAVLDTKERALRTNHWKLVLTPGMHYPIYRLYDLRIDPHCESDIKDAHPDVFAAMKAPLDAWAAGGPEARISEIFPNGEP